MAKEGRLAPTVTYASRGVSAAELQEVLSAQLGSRVVFAASKADDLFTVDLSEVSGTDLLSGLSKLGAVAIQDRRDIERNEKAGGAPLDVRVSFKAEKVQAATVARLLQGLLGEKAALQVADPSSLVTLDVEQASVRELRAVLAKIAGVRVSTRDPEAN